MADSVPEVNACSCCVRFALTAAPYRRLHIGKWSQSRSATPSRSLSHPRVTWSACHVAADRWRAGCGMMTPFAKAFEVSTNPGAIPVYRVELAADHLRLLWRMGNGAVHSVAHWPATKPSSEGDHAEAVGTRRQMHAKAPEPASAGQGWRGRQRYETYDAHRARAISRSVETSDPVETDDLEDQSGNTLKT